MDKKEQKVDIINIMSTNNMPHVSICDFDFVKDKLLTCRKITEIPKNAKSIIMTVFPYKVNQKAPKGISRYAAVPDYHVVCQKMLAAAVSELKRCFPNNEFCFFVDNSPIPEVAAAVHSGLGVIGKNGLLIHEKYGSYVFIGEIVTDLELEADKGGKKCLDCGQCSAACPTKLHKDTCLSAVNQQKKTLEEAQIEQILKSGYIWGCDICSEVCPMNQGTPPTYIKEFIDGYREEYKMDESHEGRAYAWRGPDIIKRNAKLFK